MKVVDRLVARRVPYQNLGRIRGRSVARAGVGPLPDGGIGVGGVEETLNSSQLTGEPGSYLIQVSSPAARGRIDVTVPVVDIGGAGGQIARLQLAIIAVSEAQRKVVRACGPRSDGRKVYTAQKIRGSGGRPAGEVVRRDVLINEAVNRPGGINRAGVSGECRYFDRLGSDGVALRRRRLAGGEAALAARITLAVIVEDQVPSGTVSH